MTEREYERIKDYMVNGIKRPESRAEFEERIDEMCHPNRMIRTEMLPYEIDLMNLAKNVR